MMYVLSEPTKYTFNKVGIKGKIYPMNSLTDKTKFLIIETDSGHETEIKQKESDFIYYILEGHGYFQIEGHKEKCKKGDLIVIPAGNKFYYKGKLKMLLNSTPPWNEQQEETIKKV
ncbi:cupin domain-containing protein [Candidatus Dojkabacteria bacterium]|nr:cupin domain-containing protein [Candidatus Dojkabacteria bacterium]